MRRAIAAALALTACRTVVPSAAVSEAQAPKRAPPAWPKVVSGVTPQELSDAEELVRANCLTCHSPEMLQQQRLTAAQWDATVKKMRKWGSPLEEEQEKLVVSVLSKAFGPDAQPYQNALVEDPEAAVMPLPDGAYASGDAKAGEELFNRNCGPCHGPDGRGKAVVVDGQTTAIGLNLVDKPKLYRAAEFAQTVREGRNRMPAFDHLNDREIGSVIAFLRGKD